MMSDQGSGGAARRAEYGSLVLFVYLTFLGGTATSDLHFGLRVVHQGLVTLLLGVWLIGMWRRREAWPRTPLDGALLALTLARLGSAVLGVDPRMSLELLWRPIVHLIGFYWVVWSFRRRRVELLRVTFLTAGVVCLVAFGELLSWYVGLPYISLFQQGWLEAAGLANPVPPVVWRLNVTLGGATALSAYLALLTPVAIAQLLTVSGRASRFAWLLLAAAMALAQLLTRSRGGLLSLLISLPILLYGLAPVIRPWLSEKWALLRTRARFWVCTVGGLCSLVLAAAWLLPAYTGRVETVRVRQELWRCALRMTADGPVLGVGYGNYGRVLRDCLSVHAGNYEQFTTAHNLYLHTAAETGLLGALALLWLGLVLARVARWRQQHAVASRDRLLAVAVVAALAGFAANCLVDTLTATAVVLPVMVLIGWLVWPLPGRPDRFTRMLPAAALAAIVLYGVGLAWVAVGQAHLERSFRLADQGQVAEAIAEVEKAGAIDPQLDLYKFQRAYYLGRLASTEPDSLAPAIQAFSDALASEDTFSLHWVNLAALQAAAQNWAAALGAAQRATELNPPDPQCWLNLGWIAEQMGKSDMALDAYARALAAAPAWAGSDFWKASDWRSEWRPVITGRAAVWGGHSGLIHLAIGAPDSARLLCSRPQTAPDYVCLGRSLMATGEPNAALSVFDEGLRIHPSSAALFAERAWVKKALDMSVEAGRDARIALFISPLSGSRAHMVLAQAALEGDDPDSAIDHLWRAIPPTYVSQNWEVALYNRRADFRPLPQMVRVAGGKEEMEPGLWLADLLLSQGRAEEAELVYLLLLQRDPYWREVQERLEALGRV